MSLAPRWLELWMEVEFHQNKAPLGHQCGW